jgi:hypothetical protein
MVGYMVPDLGQGEEYDDDNDDEAKEGPGAGRGEERGALGRMFESAPVKAVTNFFIDAKLSGRPIQCDEEDGTCDEMA